MIDYKIVIWATKQKYFECKNDTECSIQPCHMLVPTNVRVDPVDPNPVV